MASPSNRAFETGYYGAFGGRFVAETLVFSLMRQLDLALRGRLHPAGELVNAEPGVDDEGLALLAAAGRTVRRWPERHHYFGGVSALGRNGAAADPRRSGAVRTPADA